MSVPLCRQTPFLESSFLRSDEAARRFIGPKSPEPLRVPRLYLYTGIENSPILQSLFQASRWAARLHRRWFSRTPARWPLIFIIWRLVDRLVPWLNTLPFILVGASRKNRPGMRTGRANDDASEVNVVFSCLSLASLEAFRIKWLCVELELRTSALICRKAAYLKTFVKQSKHSICTARKFIWQIWASASIRKNVFR